MSDPAVDLGPVCPGCSEPWLRPTSLPGRYRCVNCLQRYELLSVCAHRGEHSTIVRMSDTELYVRNHWPELDAPADLSSCPGPASTHAVRGRAVDPLGRLRATGRAGGRGPRRRRA